MTHNLNRKLDELEQAMIHALEKMNGLQQMAKQAEGVPAESFIRKIEQAHHQVELLNAHIHELEAEKAQSWMKTSIGKGVEY